MGGGARKSGSAVAWAAWGVSWVFHACGEGWNTAGPGTIASCQGHAGQSATISAGRRPQPRSRCLSALSDLGACPETAVCDEGVRGTETPGPASRPNPGFGGDVKGNVVSRLQRTWQCGRASAVAMKAAALLVRLRRRGDFGWRGKPHAAMMHNRGGAMLPEET